MKNFPTLNWAIRLFREGAGRAVRLPPCAALAASSPLDHRLAKTGRSSGSRLLTIPWSTTTASSSHRASIPEIGLERRPRRHLDRPVHTRLNQGPRPVADHRGRFLDAEEVADKSHRVLDNAQPIRVVDSTGQDDGIVVLRPHVIERSVDFCVVAPGPAAPGRHCRATGSSRACCSSSGGFGETAPGI